MPVTALADQLRHHDGAAGLLAAIALPDELLGGSGASHRPLGVQLQKMLDGWLTVE